MKQLVTALLFVFPIAFLSVNTAQSQTNNASKKFKKHVNRMVQDVEEADTPEQKRAILDRSLSKYLSAFDRVKKMETVSESDRKAIAKLEQIIKEKQRELKGKKGYTRVPNNQLDNFANYIQQDLEQADTEITISATVLLLIIIILLLI